MRVQVVVAVWLVVCAVSSGGAFGVSAEWPLLANQSDPEAIERVLSGDEDTASAAWWGFDLEDSTEALQEAIDSGAKTVVVPYMGAPWVVRPVKLRSSLTLLFEPGVVVMAKKGEFKGKGDSLFYSNNGSDIVMRGYGACFTMRKEDYQSDAYEKAEWRMGIRLSGCSRVTIEGLRIEKTGGDGIYVGAGDQPYCKDIVIRDVQCVDNHRQGISVIGAENLLIENCTLSKTRGTAPQAGIDFEPNYAVNKLVNCVVRNCLIENNSSREILFYLANLSADSEPLSVRVENCLVRSVKGPGIQVLALKGPKGSIEFHHCTIEQSVIKAGIHVEGKSPESARLRFLNCQFKYAGAEVDNSGQANKEYAAPVRVVASGGIDFLNCTVHDTLDRNAVVLDDGGTDAGVHDLTGSISVHNPHGARMDVRCKVRHMELEVSQ